MGNTVDNVMRKNQLEKGDKICNYYFSNPKSITTIERVTRTQAVDTNGTKFKREITFDTYLQTIGSHSYSNSFSYLEGEELANFRAIIRKKSLVNRINNAHTILYKSGYSDADIQDIENLCALLEFMVKETVRTIPP